MNRLQTNLSPLPASAKDKAKDWQLEMLMEKLRSKASQYKSLPEISKNVRMILLEKRYALDSVEKSQHQKCLDTLQHSIKVTSLQSMVERLESLTRQLGLKFVVEPSGVFISSDMFYLEIVLEATGVVKDVKIHHEGKMEQQSCIELVNCLSQGDFVDFTAQLEGFASIYQLNAEKKVKCKAFIALESLETDLSTLSQLQMFMKEPFNLIHKSPVGIMEMRKGGHPMKLTYFVSPYDLLNVEKKDLDPINIDTIINKILGYSVTVCMEGSAAHKLQTTNLITVNRSINGKGTPAYSPLTNQNTAVIPACFVLKLNKPLPMCLPLIRQIQQIHSWTEIESVPMQPILNLIVNHCSEGKMTSSTNKGLFVTLPDQNHCYFMTETKNMEGALVTCIPFTHPAHVPSILMVLREQALFNTIISSCVRPNSKQDLENMIMFEVSALSSTHISIALEHPMEESMATAEVDLSDICNLVCRIHNPGTPPPINVPDIASELSTKILNKCFSLPVTLRSVIKLWEKQSMRRNHYSGHENFSLPLGSGDPGGHKDDQGHHHMEDFSRLNDKIRQEPQNNSGHSMMMQANQGLFLNESMMASNFPNFPPSDGVLTNELSNILSDASDKSSKRQKRKATDDLWKSGKRKVGMDDSELVESSSCDSTSRSTPLPQEIETPTSNSALGFQADLELSSLDPQELNDKTCADFNNLEEVDEIEDIHSREQGKVEKSPSNLVIELCDKNMVPPIISITPVSTSPSEFLVNTTKDKRPGSSTTSVPTSSVTITPIASSSSSKTAEEKSKDRKSSRSSKDDKNRLEKKRRKKRDESPMGPPEKVPAKQDPLCKPVIASIKPTESPPLTPTSTPTSPSMIGKYSSQSPTQNRALSSISGKLSPNLTKSSTKISSQHSPKHSPAHVPSSPKNTITGISSPKHHGTSPKHASSGSGKPSMSTLKSAANSPSNKSSSNSESKSKSSSKDSSRDKDKKLSSSIFSLSNKNKSSSLKVKPLDLNTNDVASDGLPSPSSIGDSSKANHVRSRKGSLSAIVDKLKVNAQSCDTPTDLSTKSSSSSSSSKDRTSSITNKSNELPKSSTKLVGETKNSEYMVKPSSDGMKITINKTRSKDGSSSKSSSNSTGTNKGSISTGSPKSHTGLKPGVNSGPASKKPQQIQKNSSGITNSTSTSYNSSSTGQKSSNSNTKMSSSSMKLSLSSSSTSKSKLSGSPKTSSPVTDFTKSKDRIKPSKSTSEKSIFSSMKDGNRKPSPTPSREDAESIYKSQASIMEGMMKSLDKNFQIPKLSARVPEDKRINKNETVNSINRSSLDMKMMDAMQKNDVQIAKYPVTLPRDTLFDSTMETKIRNNMNDINQINLARGEIEDNENKKKEYTQNMTTSHSGYQKDEIKNS